MHNVQELTGLPSWICQCHSDNAALTMVNHKVSLVNYKVSLQCQVNVNTVNSLTTPRTREP